MKRLSTPGFIDLQVNGFRGVDFSSDNLTVEACAFALKELRKEKTIGLLATIITSKEGLYKKNLVILSKVKEYKEFSKQLIGIHLEGPFISKEDGAVGAHRKKLVKKPDMAFIKKLIRWGQGNIRIITMAAELAGADKISRYVKKKGIIVSLGHQMAGEEDIEKLVRAGASSVTHLGNGIPNMIHRHENPIWPALSNDRLKVMIIADGHHLPDTFIKTVIRAKGIDNVIIVSDSSPVAGFPPGRYMVQHNNAILDKSGRLYNPDKKCLVGSTVSMKQCMEHLFSLGFKKGDIEKLGYFNPLRLIGLKPIS